MRTAGRSRCRCGGTVTQHSIEESCWCPSCLASSTPCTKYEPPVSRATEHAPVVATPEISRADLTSLIGRLRPGTRRKEIYDAIRNAGASGLTDDELELVTGRPHQSASATRNTLAGDGLVVDSGKRRRNRYMNLAIVWKAAGLPPTE